jgi:gluconate 2-dehydrogenase gamma chain
MGLDGHASLPQAPEAMMFLDEGEVQTLEAIVDRIITADEHSVGASQAGVVVYIDRLLAGFRHDLQLTYRIGLGQLDALCAERFGGGFAALTEGQRDDVLRLLLGNEIGGELPAGSSDVPGDLRSLAAVIRDHTIEGFFCDPLYGGNRDGAGWRLVGFPGAHWGYAPEQMALGYDAARQVPVQTITDLRAVGAQQDRS